MKATLNVWFLICVATLRLHTLLTSKNFMSNELQYLSLEDHFLTFDLGLASALVMLEYDLAAIDKSNRSKAQFIFRLRAGIDADIKRYWDGDLCLSVRHVFDTQKMLKNRLYSD